METVKENQVDYWEMGASSLAEEITKGRVTSREIVKSFIKRIESKNKEYKAIIFPMFEEALKDAKMADEVIKQGLPIGPLHGVPITIKESIAVKGTQSTWGLPERAGDLSKHDDLAVQKGNCVRQVQLSLTKQISCSF